MVKTHKKILHEHANARIFMKKYYGSVAFIIVLIIATAVLLQNFGSGDLVGMGASGFEDLTAGVAASTPETRTITFEGENIQVTQEGNIFVGTTKNRKQIIYSELNNNAYLYVDENKNKEIDMREEDLYFYNIEQKIFEKKAIVSARPAETATEKKETAEKEAVAKIAAKKSATKSTTPSFTLQDDGALTVGEANKYNLIKDADGKVYAATTDKATGEYYYIDLETGTMYDVKHTDTKRESTFLTEKVREDIKKSAAYKKWEDDAQTTDTAIIFTGQTEAEKKTMQEEDATLNGMNIPSDAITMLRNSGYTAKQIEALYNDIPVQYRSKVTADILNKEYDAINKYLSDNNYKDIRYDVATGHYSGTIGGYPIAYSGKDPDDIGVEDNKKIIYQHIDEKSGKTSYYTCPTNDCSEKTEPEAETKELKKTFRSAEKAEDKLANDVAEKGDITTVRQAAYQQYLYDQQEAQVKGILSGWLSNGLDKLLGGWSRGVPAGICAHILGLEYYKEDGWTRVPMNSSAEQLQSTLIANSRTVIIEGEKEEITESLYRYAYTLRLLANQSVEWQTYLYNSCSQETSTEVFYDYGALATGEYYSFHYAGAGAEDMIFDCEQEECLFDQACVVFTDSIEPVCVSLVHGAGFETPDAGSDYDCI